MQVELENFNNYIKIVPVSSEIINKQIRLNTLRQISERIMREHLKNINKRLNLSIINHNKAIYSNVMRQLKYEFYSFLVEKRFDLVMQELKLLMCE